MYILNKNHLSFWLRRLKTTHELIAPMRDVSGDIVLTELPRMHETALDGPALMPSPKEFLLPQMEQLFCYSEEGIEEALNKQPRVLFGIRSCDVSAIRILDTFYLGKTRDAYYEARRSRTISDLYCLQPTRSDLLLSRPRHRPFSEKRFRPPAHRPGRPFSGRDGLGHRRVARYGLSAYLHRAEAGGQRRPLRDPACVTEPIRETGQSGAGAQAHPGRERERCVLGIGGTPLL